MKLTDILVRNTKTTNKRQTLFDGGGLYLVIEPSGSREVSNEILKLAEAFEKEGKAKS